MPIQSNAAECWLFGYGSKLAWLIIVLMNLWEYGILISWTFLGILLFLPGFVLWKLFTDWETDRIMRHFIWIYGRVWLLLNLPFVRFRREGFQGKRVQPPAILVVNHLSFFDTFCMALMPIFNVVFAVRAWPFKMPWYNCFMRLANYIDVERSSWKGIVAAAHNAFDNNGFLLFFPEGHRSRNGNLMRFHMGAFRLAVETGVPIVPICIAGTDRFFPPGRYWFRPCSIFLNALAAVHPNQFEGANAHRRMAKYVRELMIVELSRNVYLAKNRQGARVHG